MYRYDEIDRSIVHDRVDQFRGQVSRRLSGDLSEEEFRPFRLQNGLYLQLHGYMLRVAIPYGTLSAAQMRTLAHIARRYDRGYGHFTTRQNIQFNWVRLDEAPDILATLANADMHAIQTSGNVIRNVTADPLAGVAADEVADPRVYCELIRQWSTLHPEFSFLPRKFKIAVAGSPADRAAIRFHDVGLMLRRDASGGIGFEVTAGGGQGRTPMVGKTLRYFLPEAHLLSYLEAILRTYNRLGRRDNPFKARIKILLHETGLERFIDMVEAEWALTRDGQADVPAGELARIRARFAPPSYDTLLPGSGAYRAAKTTDPSFRAWTDTNVLPHRVPGYAIAAVSLKPASGIPGDATAEQMALVAEAAEQFSLGEIRTTYTQNLLLPHVRLGDLHELWGRLRAAGLDTANFGLLGDMIACPGLDYCNLANARSIPVAQRISRHFVALKRQHDIGPLRLNISGCINACGHHHSADIGILGVDKKGEEFYQITLGGRGDGEAAIGSIIGPALSGEEVAGGVERIVETYLSLRRAGETFADAYRRTGPDPFRETLYATH